MAVLLQGLRVIIAEDCDDIHPFCTRDKQGVVDAVVRKGVRVKMDGLATPVVLPSEVLMISHGTLSHEQTLQATAAFRESTRLLLGLGYSIRELQSIVSDEAKTAEAAEKGVAAKKGKA